MRGGQRWFLVVASPLTAVALATAGCGSDTTSSTSTTTKAVTSSTSAAGATGSGGTSPSTTKATSVPTSVTTSSKGSGGAAGGLELCVADASDLSAKLGQKVTISTDRSRIDSMAAAFQDIAPGSKVDGCGFTAGSETGLNGSVVVITNGGRAIYDKFVASTDPSKSGEAVSIGDAGRAISTSVSANVVAYRGDTFVEVVLTDPSKMIPGDAGEQPNPAFQGKAEAIATAALG